MEKIMISLLDLKENGNYISTEKDKIESLCDKVLESLSTHQEILREQNKAQDNITLLQKDKFCLRSEIRDLEKELQSSKTTLECLETEFKHIVNLDENEYGNLQNVSNCEELLKLFDVCLNALILEDNVFQLKFLFSENKFIFLNYHLEEDKYELKQVEPEHPHFPELKAFLLESGDIAGFLFYVKCLFR